MLNKLLKRQIQKHFGKCETLPDEYVDFLNVISESYDHYEKDHKMLERSIDLSSDEMIGLYTKSRKEAEDLKRANGEVNWLLTLIDEAFFSIDMTSYQYIYIGAACKEVYGYSIEEFKASPMLWKDVIHPDDAYMVLPNDERLSRGEHIELQYRIIHKDKNIRWLNAKVIPSLDKMGNWIRTDVVVNDISVQRQYQQKLEETNHELSQLFNTINDVLFSIDVVNHRLIQISVACENIYGYGTADFHSNINLWSEVILTSDKGFIEENDIALSAGQTCCTQYRIRHKDGTLRWVETKIIPTLDEHGQLIRLDGLTSDITDEKRIEEILGESEERYRLIAENPKIGINWSAPDGKLISANDGFCKMLGFTEAEMYNMHFSMFTHPDDLLEDKPFIEKIFNGETNNFRSEIRYISKKKEVIWAELNLSSVKDENGNVKYTIAVIQDISARKKAEVELKALNRSLESKVNERTAQLIQVNKDLEAYNYTVSHDLRTPLKAVEIFLSLAKEKVAKMTNNVSLNKYLDNIDEGTKEMNMLIQHLLEFSRKGKELSQQELIMSNIVMKDMITDVFNTLKSLENGKKIILRLQDTPDVNADKTLMKLVLTNLISNAIKYSSRNQEIIVEVGGIQTEGFVEYYVKDNGAGFNMNDVDRLFKPFSRLHSATEFNGTGAGLAIVDKIIHFHNGKVQAVSNIGQGATFYFSIPINNEK